MRFIFRGNRRPYGIPPPRPLLLSSSAMPCFLGTPSLCPPLPCPVSSARRVSALLRHVRSLRHAASLSPHRGHRITCCPPLHRFPPRPFPGIRPVSTLLMTDYSLLHLPCPGIPFLGIRPAPALLVPSRPFSSLLVPSRPFSSPPLYSLFPAPVVPAVFSGGRRFWHENAKYFFIWEIIVNFLLLLAFNVK